MGCRGTAVQHESETASPAGQRRRRGQIRPSISHDRVSPTKYCRYCVQAVRSQCRRDSAAVPAPLAARARANIRRRDPRRTASATTATTGRENTTSRVNAPIAALRRGNTQAPCTRTTTGRVSANAPTAGQRCGPTTTATAHSAQGDDSHSSSPTHTYSIAPSSATRERRREDSRRFEEFISGETDRTSA